MPAEMQVLVFAATSIACLHTATGPDHYLPFIVLSKSRQWSLGRTLFWTIVCGCGHVWSSVVLGLGGAALGWSLSKLEFTQEVKGGLAGWCLLSFGLGYAVWGIVRERSNRRHKHFDLHPDGSIYVFEHKRGEVVKPAEKHKVTPWVMFIIFILGPCEPMIPLLYYPAANNSGYGIFVLVAVYTFFTLLTMIALVLLGYYGISIFKTGKLERHMHSLAGCTLFVCGASMVLLGW